MRIPSNSRITGLTLVVKAGHTLSFPRRIGPSNRRRELSHHLTSIINIFRHSCPFRRINVSFMHHNIWRFRACGPTPGRSIFLLLRPWKRDGDSRDHARCSYRVRHRCKSCGLCLGHDFVHCPGARLVRQSTVAASGKVGRAGGC